MPWLTATATSSSGGPSRKRILGVAEDHPEEAGYVIDEPVPDGLPDDDTEALFCALEAKRREWEAVERGAGSVLAFKMCLLKGAWTKEHKGRDLGFGEGQRFAHRCCGVVRSLQIERCEQCFSGVVWRR